jgi:hypothetical protein
MTELTTFCRFREIACPAYTDRAISSSVSRVFWPHLTIAATAAVPDGKFANGYSAPGETASTVRSETIASDCS